MTEKELPLRCPSCRESTGLWEEVEVLGWRGIDEHGHPSGDRDIDWGTAESLGAVGCSCGWEGFRNNLEFVLGVDGEPLPDQIPGQLDLSEATP